MPPPGGLEAAGIRSVTVHDGKSGSRAGTGQPLRRDRHGRGSLIPPDVPLHRTRAERFDDLVLLAVSQLEPRWEAELSGIEFAVEEIPPAGPDTDDPDPVPLARLELSGPPVSTTQPVSPAPPASPATPVFELPGLLPPIPAIPAPAAEPHPARIVLYRRPLMARADGEEELAELVLDVVVEEFAHWLGVDPQTVDPGYPGDE
jgi:Zincin-like metallopeptidase